MRQDGAVGTEPECKAVAQSLRGGEDRIRDLNAGQGTRVGQSRARDTGPEGRRVWLKV